MAQSKAKSVKTESFGTRLANGINNHWGKLLLVGALIGAGLLVAFPPALLATGIALLAATKAFAVLGAFAVPAAIATAAAVTTAVTWLVGAALVGLGKLSAKLFCSKDKDAGSSASLAASSTSAPRSSSSSAAVMTSRLGGPSAPVVTASVTDSSPLPPSMALSSSARKPVAPPPASLSYSTQQTTGSSLPFYAGATNVPRQGSPDGSPVDDMFAPESTAFTSATAPTSTSMGSRV